MRLFGESLIIQRLRVRIELGAMLIRRRMLRQPHRRAHMLLIWWKPARKLLLMRHHHRLGRHRIRSRGRTQLPRAMSCPHRSRRPSNGIRRDVSTIRITRQRPPLDPARSTLSKLIHPRQALRGLSLGPRVVVCELYPQFAGIFALVVQSLPEIALAAARSNDLGEIDPGLADEIGALVFAEDGDFELVVVGGLVDGEAEFLIPMIHMRQLMLLQNEGRREW